MQVIKWKVSWNTHGNLKTKNISAFFILLICFGGGYFITMFKELALYRTQSEIIYIFLTHLVS
jgi:hypothetical protein